jgi:hypothetical protein
MHSDFMSALQDLTPEVIHTKKYSMNKGWIFNGYGAKIIEIQNNLNLTWSVSVTNASCNIETSKMQFLFSVYFAFIHHVF